MGGTELWNRGNNINRVSFSEQVGRGEGDKFITFNSFEF